jgi:hypothetical protein
MYSEDATMIDMVTYHRHDRTNRNIEEALYASFILHQPCTALYLKDVTGIDASSKAIGQILKRKCNAVEVGREQNRITWGVA